MRYSQAASFQAWCEELIDRYQYMWDAAINSGKIPTAATRLHCIQDRGREGRLIPASPAAKPDEQISRIRLSSQWAVFTD